MIASAAHTHGPYVVRGILNRGNTCFVNALVQCLLALGKMGMSMFEPDAPAGSLGVALKDFFVEIMAGNVARATLNLDRLLDSLGALKTKYKNRTQGDSHELLIYLRDGLNDEELRKRPPDMPKDVPTVVDSIFQGQLFETLTCKCCSKQSPRLVEPFYDLLLKLPPKGHPMKSIAPQRSNRRKRQDIRGLFQQIRKEGKFTCSCT
jgi:ubiquitin carboxyl-terminal hydrolase 16/45